MQTKLSQALQHYKQSSRWLRSNFLHRTSQRLCNIAHLLYMGLCNQLSAWKHRYFHIKKNLTIPYTQPFSQKLFLWKLQVLRVLRQRIQSSLYFFNHKQKRLAYGAHSLNQKIFQEKQSLLNINKRIISLTSHQLHAYKENMITYDNTLYQALRRIIERNQEKYHTLYKQLLSLNPKHVLQRGYAMLFDFNKHCAIISVKNLQKHHQIKVRLHDGEAILSVEDVQYL